MRGRAQERREERREHVKEKVKEVVREVVKDKVKEHVVENFKAAANHPAAKVVVEKVVDRAIDVALDVARDVAIERTKGNVSAQTSQSNSIRPAAVATAVVVAKKVVDHYVSMDSTANPVVYAAAPSNTRHTPSNSQPNNNSRYFVSPSAPPAEHDKLPNATPVAYASHMLNSCDEGGVREFLSTHKWPLGLQNTLISNVRNVGYRFFVCDDSGSMNTTDGHYITGESNSNKK